MEIRRISPKNSNVEYLDLCDCAVYTSRVQMLALKVKTKQKPVLVQIWNLLSSKLNKYSWQNEKK